MIKKENVLQIIDKQLERLSSDILASEDAEAVLLVVRNKIANMPEEDEWIPVEQGLPIEEYDTVLVVTDVNHYSVAVYTTEHGFRTGDIDITGKIIAWQPLSELYKPTISLKNSMTMRKFIEGSNR